MVFRLILSLIGGQLVRFIGPGVDEAESSQLNLNENPTKYEIHDCLSVAVLDGGLCRGQPCWLYTAATNQI
jgi:hypothetical protein